MQLGNLSGPLLDGGHYELVSRFVPESAEPDTTADQLSDELQRVVKRGQPYLLGGSKVSQPSLHHIGLNLHRSGTTLSRRSWATNQPLRTPGYYATGWILQHIIKCQLGLRIAWSHSQPLGCGGATTT